MALVKCSECNKDVSDKATACPFCGNPIGENPLTIQQTNKRWKKFSLLAFVIAFAGFIVSFSNGSLGVSLIFLALLIAIFARIGAWWTNG